MFAVIGMLQSFVCLSVLEYCLSGCLLFRKKTLAEFWFDGIHVTESGIPAKFRKISVPLEIKNPQENSAGLLYAAAFRSLSKGISSTEIPPTRFPKKYFARNCKKKQNSSSLSNYKCTLFESCHFPFDCHIFIFICPESSISIAPTTTNFISRKGSYFGLLHQQRN